MTGTPAKRTTAMASDVDPDGVVATDASVDAEDSTEAVAAATVDPQSVLAALASLGITAEDVSALAAAKRAKANHGAVDLNAGNFPERIAAHRQRAEEVKNEDPDLAEKLLATARGLQGEHKLAVSRGDAYQPHADICELDFPDGWPLGHHHASCEHGEYDR